MSDRDTPIRSNIPIWKELQAREYFGTDRNVYSGENNEIRVPDPDIVEWFRPISDDMVMAIIGCGYGRESTHFGKRVGHVYGIDVSEHVLKKTVAYTGERGVTNFTPVLAESYREQVPQGLDFVYSIVVMQHLTRDLVRDYFSGLGRKLKPGGFFVVQFFEYPPGGSTADAGDEIVEPSVSWSVDQLTELCRAAGLAEVRVKTMELVPNIIWHFLYCERPA